jgi:hypothetical protein
MLAPGLKIDEAFYPMLMQGTCRSPIQACSFMKAALEKTELLCRGNLRRS